MWLLTMSKIYAHQCDRSFTRHLCGHGSPWYLGKTKDKKKQLINFRTGVQIAVGIHSLAFCLRFFIPTEFFSFINFFGTRVWPGRGLFQSFCHLFSQWFQRIVRSDWRRPPCRQKNDGTAEQLQQSSAEFME